MHIAAMEAVKKPLLPSPVLKRFSAHHFASAPSGVDSNLLILLHGLGDSDAGFFNLGKGLQKTLPQTAVLTVQAPIAVPFLDPGMHWMWYPTFDNLGEVLTAPNPTETVQHFTELIQHLVEHCGWLASSVHIFGFGQGATVALETLVAWFKSHTKPTEALGSIVSVSGEFVSHPTLAQPSCMPILHLYRSSNEVNAESARWASFRKASTALTLQRLPLTADGGEEGMLRGTEWDSVMQFWSRILRSRSSWELSGDVVPIAGGRG